MKKLILFLSLTLSFMAQANDQYLQLTIKEIFRRGLFLKVTVVQGPGLKIEAGKNSINFSDDSGSNRMRFADQLSCAIKMIEETDYGRILRPGRSFILDSLELYSTSWDTNTGVAREIYFLDSSEDPAIERLTIDKTQLDIVYIHLFDLQQGCKGLEFEVIEDTELVDA